MIAADHENYGEPIPVAPPMLERGEVNQGGREPDLSLVDRADQILSLPHADGDNMLGVTKVSRLPDEI